MSEIDDIISFYDRLSGSSSERCALATVIYTVGPSYRSAGARSLITDEGTYRGGLSAGCLEGDVGCRLESTSEPFIVEYDLSTEDEVRGFPFGCGGKLGVFVEPLSLDTQSNPLDAVRWLATLREPAVLLTLIKSDCKNIKESMPLGSRFGISHSGHLYQADLQFAKFVGVEKLCTDVFATKKSRVEELVTASGRFSVFAEYFTPAVSLCIFGDSEDARVLEQMAQTTGMKVQRFSKHDIRVAVANVSSADINHSYNLVMTHDLYLDSAVINRLLKSTSPYIGILGPRSRTEKMLNALELDANQILALPNFYSPVGLDMGAETPQEIALSILAEIQTVAHQRRPEHLKKVSGPIHDRSEKIKCEIIQYENIQCEKNQSEKIFSAK